MPKKYRVAVTLTKEEYEAVSFLAESGQTSMAKVLSWPIKAAMPSLEKLAQVQQMTSRLEESEKQQVIEGFEQAENTLLNALNEVSPIIDDIVKSQGRARVPDRGRVCAPDPRIVTRGFREVKSGDYE